MNSNRKKILLPTVTAVGSFFLMIILAASTSPIEKITYAIPMFILLAIFLVSIGYGVTYLHSNTVSPKSRFRILLVSFLLLIALMLRSSQALNLVDALVLIIIGYGLWFYSGRR
jgi:hypothetical protein